VSNTTPIKPAHGNKALKLIGVFKLLKGTLLLLAAIGMFRLLHRDLTEMAWDLADQFRVDPDNRYLAALLAKLGLVDDRKLEELGFLTCIYAALFFTEGTGLWLGKRWAEWLTVVATCSLVPLEIYEFVRKMTPIRGSLLAGNVAIVIYLVVVLKRNGGHGQAPPEQSAGR